MVYPAVPQHLKKLRTSHKVCVLRRIKLATIGAPMQDLANSSKVLAWNADGEPSRRPRSASFATMCNTANALALAIAVAGVVLGHHLVGFVAGAVLCGVAEAQGRCGLSHIGMIAPLKCFAPRNWLKCSLAYSIAGLATAYLVGLAVAGLGSLATVVLVPAFVFWAAGAVALVVLLRALELIRFKLLQCDLQTHRSWMAEFGMTTVAGMWGAHIGLAFLTVIKHAGLYPLALVAAGCGLGGGEFVLVAFWVGRILPLWLAPSISGRSGDGVAIVDSVCDAAQSFRVTAVCGLAILGALCVACATSSVTGFAGGLP